MLDYFCGGLRRFACIVLVPAVGAFVAVEAGAQDYSSLEPLYVTLTEEAGLDRDREPVEFEITLARPAEADGDLVEQIRSSVRVYDLSGGVEQEIPSQVFDVRIPGSGDIVRAKVAFLATVGADSQVRYRVIRDATGPAPRYSTDLSVEGEGIERTIENEHFRIITDPVSGQIDRIELKFATEPSFHFPAGNMHWNPDFIIAADDYPEGGTSWMAARHMEHPDYEVESGPVFFSIHREQVVPNQDKMFVEVYYRFYEGLPWFEMQSRMEVIREFRSFGIRNDELAFGPYQFTHAGWREQSIGLHPRHRGEMGSIPLLDESRLDRHVLGSSLHQNIPWLSYSHGEEGYAVASLRLGWDNRNILTGHPAPIVNARTVLSISEGTNPYWFRTLVYTPRRAEQETFFNLPQETITEMLQLIPRGTSYFERNAYYFYPFDWDNNYAPPDDLYLRLTQPLRVDVEVGG